MFVSRYLLRRFLYVYVGLRYICLERERERERARESERERARERARDREREREGGREGERQGGRERPTCLACSVVGSQHRQCY